MAKRLTDTDKWKDEWYLQLSNDDKIVWQWLLDNCNHAGILKRNVSLLNLMCGVKYTEAEVIEKMDTRLIVINNSWFIPKFIKFQYTTLLSGKPVIISVVKELFLGRCVEIMAQFGNDYTIISKSFDNHCQMIKDKDKDKSKDKDKGGVGENKKTGIKFTEDSEYVIFDDNSKRQLTISEKIRLEQNDIQPYEIFKR